MDHWNRFLGSIKVKKSGFGKKSKGGRWRDKREGGERNLRGKGRQDLSSNFLTFKEPKEPIPPCCVAWRAGTTTQFLRGSYRLFKNSSTGYEWAAAMSSECPKYKVQSRKYKVQSTTKYKVHRQPFSVSRFSLGIIILFYYVYSRRDGTTVPAGH